MTHDEPTSHEYLYEMDRENLFRLFVAQVNSLTVDERGVWCLPVESRSLQRISRAVQERTVDAAEGTAEHTLRSMATVTRILVSQFCVSTNGRRPPAADVREFFDDDGNVCAPEDSVGWASAPYAGIVDMFHQCRAELPDLLPAAPAAVLDVGPDELWSDEQLATLPVCGGCELPMIPGVSHSRCA